MSVNNVKHLQETLLPYVDAHLEEFIKASWEEAALKSALEPLEQKDPTVEKTVELLQKLGKDEPANASLKSVQGLVYKKGYEDGSLKAQ